MGAISNTLKTTILLALLTAIALWIGNAFGGTAGIVIAVIFVVLMNGVMYWFSDKLVLRMYKAKELPASHSVTKMVRDLAHLERLPMPKVYIVPSANPNAFATGRNPKHAAIAVTQGILNLLSDEELKGVLAHELSHVKHRDTLISAVAAMVAGVISFVGVTIRWAAIFGGFSGDDDNSLVELLIMAIVAPVVAVILQMAVSRTREYAADANAARLLKTGKPLASALKKLEHGVVARPMHGSTATEHMFIVNPFRGFSFFELFSTHPSTEKRVARLDEIRF